LRICVDTTILIDVLKDEFRPFQEKLYDAIAHREQLVSPVVVFGELMPQFPSFPDAFPLGFLCWRFCFSKV
jgi:hypothetical protein